jgi:hypothetical protein
MKQWLSYILIILFSFQALPVKELRKLLIKKAITEQVGDESSDSNDTSKQFAEKDIEKLFVHTQLFHLTAIYSMEQVKVALHNLPVFEDHFHPDITTPPPDAAHC